ncbi:MAG: antitoxin [Gammaproteobacteria bacterium]
MDTTRIFQTGRSQAVCLLKSYRFSGQEVIGCHFGAGVLLLPLVRPWDLLEAALTEFEPGFALDVSSHQIRNEPCLSG